MSRFFSFPPLLAQLLLPALVLLLAAGPSRAQENFFAGQTIVLISSSDAGGTAGTYARLLSEFLGPHIPGEPTVVIQFMPGAGGMVGANFCYNRAPKDGTMLCSIQPGLPHLQRLDPRGVRFDVTEFNYLGRTSSTNSAIYVRSALPVMQLLDVREHEVILGATGRAADTFVDPTVINSVLGTQFRIILGYPGGGEIDYALENGEIDGDAGPVLSVFLRRQNWIDNGEIRFLVQTGTERHPRLPETPLLTEFASSEAERAMFEFLSLRSDIGYTLLAPSGVPEERLAILAQAMADTLNDPAFRSAAERLSLDVIPASRAEIGEAVERVFETPDDVVERMRAALEIRN
jgi:tripartite-type tricarboxylate transporter receptor subunit TctC